MVYFDGVGGLIFLAVWVFCFIDVLVTPEAQCRNLPKLAWVFIVLLFSLIGSIAWLVAGHTWGRTGSTPARPSGSWLGSRVPAAGGAGRPSSPDDDEEFLAGLRQRAEEQRRRAREQQDGAERERPDSEPA